MSRRTVAILAAVALSGCAPTDQSADAIPGPTLEGPNVVRYPLAPYVFKTARTEIRQGFRSVDGCGMANQGGIEPGDADVQEIVIAEDPDTCRFLVVTGEPDDG
jgi:hypothetical protein